MRVVIVGGAGFIGTSLIAVMRESGLSVCVLDSAHRLARSSMLMHGAESAEFNFGFDDPALSKQLHGADVLIHLACTTNPARSMETFAYDAESNIGPSIRLFDAAVKAGVRRVVFASSGGTVYGAPPRLPVREVDRTLPVSAYGVSKLAIENYLSLYSQLQGISLRIANPYGPYQLKGAAVGVIARYVQATRRGEPIEVWGDGSVVRDYIAMEDVAEAFRLAATAETVAPGIYNIGSGIGTDLNGIIEVIGSIAQRHAQVRYLERRTYDVPAIVLDSSLFSSKTQWSARKPLHEGIMDLWQQAQA